jgi:hypothetical protein
MTLVYIFVYFFCLIFHVYFLHIFTNVNLIYDRSPLINLLNPLLAVTIILLSIDPNDPFVNCFISLKIQWMKIKTKRTNNVLVLIHRWKWQIDSYTTSVTVRSDKFSCCWYEISCKLLLHRGNGNRKEGRKGVHAWAPAFSIVWVQGTHTPL